MTKKIFHSILLVAGAVLLASLFVITGALYEYFGIIQKKQLKDELGLAAVSVEQQGDDFLKRLPRPLPHYMDKHPRQCYIRHPYGR